MSAETTEKFISDIRSRIDYFRDEFNITYAEAIGSLDILKYELLDECMEEKEPEGDDP